MEKINLLLLRHSDTLDESGNQRNPYRTYLEKKYENDPSATPKDPNTYTRKELLQQNTKLLNQVHTIRTKTIKLDSLILEEQDNVKECLNELDLLKKNLTTNSIENLQEEQANSPIKEESTKNSIIELTKQNKLNSKRLETEMMKQIFRVKTQLNEV